jgi:hypothetical protein
MQGRHIGLDGHHVVGAPAQDDLRGVMLRVHRVDRQDCPGQAGERLQQLPHRGDLVGLLVHGDLAEDRADAVRQGRDQVRGLPVRVPRTANGLPVNGDHQPPAGPHRPRPQPGAQDPVESIGAGQGEGPPERRFIRRAADSAQHGEHLRAGVSGPLPDRGERPRARDHCLDPDGEQARQRMPATAPLPRVRDLGKEIEQILAAGSRHRRRCHRRAGVPRGRRWRA